MQFPSNPTDALVAMSAFKCGTDDPSVVPTEGAPGQIYVMMLQGSVGAFQKQDSGYTTNWVPLGSGGLNNIPGYYPVYVGGPYASIQAAVDQAVLDGYGDLNPALVQIFPGVFTEDVVMVNGINISGVDQLSCVVEGEFSFAIPAGGTPNGSSLKISNLTHRQVLGKSCLVVTDTNPGDQCLLVQQFCTYISANVLETASTIDIQAMGCAYITTNINGAFSGTNPGVYLLQFAGFPTSQNNNWFVSANNGNALHAIRQITMNNSTLFFGGGTMATVEGGVFPNTGTLNLGNCTVAQVSGGGGVCVDLLAPGASVTSFQTAYFIGIGGLIWQGIAGTQVTNLNSIFLFVSDYSMAITLVTPNTTPTPV